jgi:hypothetical protein
VIDKEAEQSCHVVFLKGCVKDSTDLANQETSALQEIFEIAFSPLGRLPLSSTAALYR